MTKSAARCRSVTADLRSAKSSRNTATRTRTGNCQKGKNPGKQHYLSSFHRGLELCGDRTAPRDWMNFQVTTVSLGSTKVTTEQLDKLTLFARRLTNNRILLTPDCDEEDETGFKDLVWKLCEAPLEVRLCWSSKTHLNRHGDRQTESLSQGGWPA